MSKLLKERITPELLDECEIAIFVGKTKDGKQLIFIPFTHTPDEKLGLLHYALKIVETDTLNQVVINREASQALRDRVLNSNV